MKKKEKTNTAMLWIAILVLEISLVIDSYFERQIHQQLNFQQQKIQKILLEHLNQEVEWEQQVNHLLEQIPDIVEVR